MRHRGVQAGVMVVLLTACGARSDLSGLPGGPRDGGPNDFDARALGGGARDGSSSDGVSVDGSGLDAGPACRDGLFALSSEPVFAVLLIDASLSMGFGYDGNPILPGDTRESRWMALERALDFGSRFIDERVQIGGKLYPSDHGTRGPGRPCEVHPGLDVPIERGGPGGVLEEMGWRIPRGGSPIGPAVREAAAALADRRGARVMVIATDGAPTCSDTALEEAVDEIRRVRDALGVDSVVVGIAGREDERAALDAMAVAGGRPRPPATGARFYDAVSSERTIDAFAEVARELSSCLYPVPGGGPGVAVEVRVDGEPVARDTSHTDGWDFTGASRTQIGFFGAACDRLATWDGRVEASVTCP